MYSLTIPEIDEGIGNIDRICAEETNLGRVLKPLLNHLQDLQNQMLTILPKFSQSFFLLTGKKRMMKMSSNI